MRRRVAIVTPWYGEECTGGAELLALELAKRLGERDSVTVLTTTSRSFLHAWDVDHYSPGKSRQSNHDVIRFRIKARKGDVFNAINETLLGCSRDRWWEIAQQRVKLDQFIEESINSPELERHLARHGRSQYDAVLALPYLYGVVVRAIEMSNRPIDLIPCLHDEAYARIPRIEDAFHKARTLLFNSPGEAEVALGLYGPGILHKSHVIGAGVPPPTEAASQLALDKPYYLYLGRREPEKGIDRLIDAFRRYKMNGARHEMHLALAGPGTRSYANSEQGIHDFGLVDEATKATLLKNAVALLNPSRNESYSRVLMEAWREEVPVVVDADCLATATAVRESNGGFLAGTSDEWVSVLQRIEAMAPSERRQIGAQGASYAAEHADWDKAIARLRRATGLDDSGPVKRNGKRIDQVLEGADRGDAISDDARGIRERLRQLGYDSTIYARHIAPSVDDVHLLSDRLAPADGIIYHHSIGSDVADRYIAAKSRKAVIYHNVTPAAFFEPYVPDVARQLQRGRDQVAPVVAASHICVGDSEFNADEMRQAGGRSVRTIPVATSFQRWDVTPRTRTLRAKHGSTWLFVGRVSPNKGLRALIQAFKVFLDLQEDAALVIQGKYAATDPYYNNLKAEMLDYGIDPYVTVTGYNDEATMAAYYRNADVFVCLSEHEGFCVPLVEAMFFDVPIVAKALTAVPSTLGRAGLLLEPDADAYDVAAAVHEVCTDKSLRAQILAAQRERRRDFLPSRVDPLIDKLAVDLVPT